MELTHDTLTSPLGTMLAWHDADAALVALAFEDRAASVQAWLARQGCNIADARPAPVLPTRRALGSYFEGDLAALDALAVHWSGTAFQRQCWAALQRIAPGTTLSYAEQASRIGVPGAARAVGRANAMNPIVVVVPCHRVIGANAALTGYAGGLERKRWLLAHEARHCGAGQRSAA